MSDFHYLDLKRPSEPCLSGLLCRCGFYFNHTLTHPRLTIEVAAHMTDAGLCPECWGATMVSQRATRDAADTPMAGNLIDCPGCGASGHSVGFYARMETLDRSTYFNRLQMLELHHLGGDRA